MIGMIRVEAYLILYPQFPRLNTIFPLFRATGSPRSHFIEQMIRRFLDEGRRGAHIVAVWPKAAVY
jgi:hypothetical protein